MLVIFANIIVMCLNYDDESIAFENDLKLCNDIFSGIFFIECVLKVIGMGVYPYLY